MRYAATCTVCAFTVLTACSTNHLSTASIGCRPVNMADTPHPAGEGVITRLLTQSQATTLLSSTEDKIGRPIDGAYVNNIRAIVKADDGSINTVLIPLGMAAAVSDRVSFQSAYLSPTPLCSYVPNLATRKL